MLCITAILSSLILPHILGCSSFHEVWISPGNCCSSLSRYHLHNLKHELFNVRKPLRLNYIDFIQDSSGKYGVAGSPGQDEEYTLRGLPLEFSALTTPVRTIYDSFSYQELASSVTSEELNMNHSSS